MASVMTRAPRSDESLSKWKNLSIRDEYGLVPVKVTIPLETVQYLLSHEGSRMVLTEVRDEAGYWSNYHEKYVDIPLDDSNRYVKTRLNIPNYVLGIEFGLLILDVRGHVTHIESRCYDAKYGCLEINWKTAICGNTLHAQRFVDVRNEDEQLVDKLVTAKTGSIAAKLRYNAERRRDFLRKKTEDLTPSPFDDNIVTTDPATLCEIVISPAPVPEPDTGSGGDGICEMAAHTSTTNLSDRGSVSTDDGSTERPETVRGTSSSSLAFLLPGGKKKKTRGKSTTDLKADKKSKRHVSFHTIKSIIWSKKN